MQRELGSHVLDQICRREVVFVGERFVIFEQDELFKKRVLVELSHAENDS